MTANEPRRLQLSDMAECAYRLGVAFGAAAEAAKGTDQWLVYFNAFDRCFFSVRVSTALELRLGRSATEPREAASDREDLERPDPPEPDTDDRERGDDERDRDRDRETERASLPILLRALQGVVADAQKLPGPAPAELLTLRELLAHAKAAPSPAAPMSSQSLRSRVTGSGAAAAPAPTRSPASNVGQILAARRATGPPRR
ncbi:MAG TPA: hypothetical protein VGC92_00310 [Phenylobacterium sp.]|jgi:hypothetical protein